MTHSSKPNKALKKARHLSKVDYEAQAEFRYALRRFLRFSEEVTRSHGMTPQKYQALLAIRGFPGRDAITIGELAERLQIKHHSAVGIVDRMETQGLVQRQPGANDRRQVYVSLTTEGNRIVEQLVKAHRVELQHLWPQLELPVKRLQSS